MLCVTRSDESYCPARYEPARIVHVSYAELASTRGRTGGWREQHGSADVMLRGQPPAGPNDDRKEFLMKAEIETCDRPRRGSEPESPRSYEYPLLVEQTMFDEMSTPPPPVVP